MALGRDFKSWRLDSFAGGLNTAVDAKHVPPNESPDLNNIELTLDGVVSRRRGHSAYQSSFTGSAPFAAEWWSEGRFVVARSDGQLLVITDSGVATVSVASALTTSGIASGFSMNGAFYIHTREDGAKRITPPSTGLDITAGQGDPLAGDPDGTDPQSPVFPKARYSAVLRDRVFVANTVESSLNFFSRIRFSQEADPESWAYNDYFDIAPDDFDEVTGLAVVSDRLVIFKRSSIYMLAGHTRDSFSIIPITQGNLGCPYPKTICRGDNVIYFMSQDGVKEFNGSQIRHLSIKVDPIVGTPIAAAYANRKYYLVVDDSGTRRVYVYEADLRAWTRWSGVPAKRILADHRSGENETRIYASSSAAAQMLRLETGDTDAGSAITAYYTTGWLDLGMPEVRKRTRRVYVTHGDDQVNDLTVKVYKDWDDATVRQTITGADPTNDHDVTRSPAVGTARAVRVRLENVTGGAMHVDAVTFSFIPRRFR